MSILSMLSKGGWLMIPLFISSVIAVGIIIERYIVIKKSKLNVPAFLVKIRGMLIKEDISGAISYCIEEKSAGCAPSPASAARHRKASFQGCYGVRRDSGTFRKSRRPTCRHWRQSVPASGSLRR